METSSIPELEKSIHLFKDDLNKVEMDTKLTMERSNEISKRIETQDYEDIDELNQLQSVNESLLKQFNELSLNRVLCQRKIDVSDKKIRILKNDYKNPEELKDLEIRIEEDIKYIKDCDKEFKSGDKRRTTALRIPNRRRTFQVKVMLNRNEHDLLNELVQMTGTDKSTFMRDLLNNVKLNKGIYEPQVKAIENAKSDLKEFENNKYQNNNIKEIDIFEPSNFDEATQAISSLDEGNIVIINLLTMDADQAQRATDFIAGAAYSMKGEQEKIGESIFIFTPFKLKINNKFALEGTYEDKFQPAPNELDKLNKIFDEGSMSDETKEFKDKIFKLLMENFKAYKSVNFKELKDIKEKKEF